MYNYRPAKRNNKTPKEQEECSGCGGNDDDQQAVQQKTNDSNAKKFANEKRQALVHKVDRSRKGQLDELVVPLAELINADSRYYTTSCCSGRLTLCGWIEDAEKKEVVKEESQSIISEDEPEIEKKKGHSFQCLFDRHQAGWYGESMLILLRNVLDNPGDEFTHINLKFEPVIFHVRALNLEAATALLQVAIQAGFRHSGIITTTGATDQSSCIVALRHTLQLEVPLVIKGELVVLDQYIHQLVQVVNGKFAANQAAIARLEDDIRTKLFTN